MEERKQKEAKFHDEVRKGIREGSDEYKGFVHRRRFYSIVRQSNNFFREYLRKNCAGKKVLDFGCGEGDLVNFLAENGAEVIGIDISEASIQIAKERFAANKKASFYVMDAETLEFKGNSFDLIACAGILHHLDIDKAYQELSRVLKPEGKIICNEPLVHNPIFQLYRKLTPHLRTEWEVEHILHRNDIRLAEKYFEKVEKRFFHLTTLLAVFFRNTPIFNFLLTILERFDAAIFKLPLIKWWAWQIIFILSQPKIKNLSSGRYLFYVHSCGELVPESGLPEGYHLRIWRPSIFGLTPKGLSKFPFIVWSSMHYLRLLTNSNYRVFLVYYDGKIIHYSVVLPKHFKYPFMDQNDIQIGPCWTSAEHRRRGIASYVVRKITETYKGLGCRFWYLTREENIPSRKFIESLGFLKYGEGHKKKRIGIGALGHFSLKHKY